MARAVHTEQFEISRDYVNLPDPEVRPRYNRQNEACCGPHGRNFYKPVAISFGVLCILQVALNISLRLAFNNPQICKNGTKDSAEQRKMAEKHFQEGWVYFHSSFYRISFDRKTWKDSRNDCLRRGADLVVVDTTGEENFIRQFAKFIWIGLRDVTSKGNWKWVDGTPLTKSYWAPSEPNNHENRIESCVEMRFFEQENSWNDLQCEDENFWICEKKSSLFG